MFELLESMTSNSVNSLAWVTSLGEILVVWCRGKVSGTGSFQERWLENPPI